MLLWVVLTIRKGQDTDDQEEEDDYQQTDTEVVICVLIIPVTAQIRVWTKTWSFLKQL